MSTVGPYTRATTVDDDARVHVEQRREDRYFDGPYEVAKGEWAVWLPHDCDEWVIGYGTREQTAEQVRLLIASLTEALNILTTEAS